ncbi:MAG: ABC transporter permease [Chloroflexia bacterium]
MSGLGLYIGLTTRNTQTTFLVINFFTLPLLFTSTAWLPLAFLPEWLQAVAIVNPVTYAVNGIRVIVTGLNAEQVATGQTLSGVIAMAAVVLAALAAAALGIATWSFRKQVQ